MIDVDLFFAALLAVVATRPWGIARRYLPRVGGDVEAVQRAYERGYSRRAALRLLVLVLLAYFVVRAVTAAPSFHLTHDLMVVVFGGVGTTFVLSAIAATVWRYRWDRAFVARHPEFVGSVQPLGLRLTGTLVAFVAFGLLEGGFASQNPEAVFGFLGAAFVALFAGQRLMLAALVRSRTELPLDSPFGRVAAETVARFGFTPKRVILAPSTVANAFALPDGTVMVTTALRAIASDDEIAAVLAHELSHARDGDVPRMRRAARLTWLLSILVGGGAAYGLAALPGGEPFVFPVVVLLVLVFMIATTALRTPMLHRLEFKCDQAAAEFGRGPELARCLTKIHATMGIPTRWVGVERRLMTHPSLDDRLAALGNAPGKA